MVTSRDVAKTAGVSQATVSRVLSGNPTVGAETRARVLAALESTGYVPNFYARAMKTRRTRTVGVVTGHITNPFYPELIEAIARKLAAAGERMVLWTTGGTSEEAAVDAIRGGAVDGVIFTTATIQSEALEIATNLRAPIVLVNRSIDGSLCDQVTSDNFSAGVVVAEYFIRHGRTELAVIGGNDATVSIGRERRSGFLDRLQQEGLDAQWRPSTFTHQGGYDAAISLLKHRERRPSTIFCTNDVLAFGLMDAARELSIRIPDDLWVVGHDDVHMASWPMLNLTTVRQPTETMAKVAVDTILRRIEDPGAELRSVQLETHLVVRGSTNFAPL